MLIGWCTPTLPALAGFLLRSRHSTTNNLHRILNSSSKASLNTRNSNQVDRVVTTLWGVWRLWELLQRVKGQPLRLTDREHRLSTIQSFPPHSPSSLLTPHTQPFPDGNDFNDFMTKFLLMWASSFCFVLICFSSGSGNEAHCGMTCLHG
jgi:hypothetical protein